jgi:hypothetical protein
MRRRRGQENQQLNQRATRWPILTLQASRSRSQPASGHGLPRSLGRITPKPPSGSPRCCGWQKGTIADFSLKCTTIGLWRWGQATSMAGPENTLSAFRFVTECTLAVGCRPQLWVGTRRRSLFNPPDCAQSSKLVVFQRRPM